MPDNTVRLLVKTRAGAPGARLAVGRVKLRFAAEPLFKSIDAPRRRLAAAGAATWQVLTPVSDERGIAATADVATPWDLCHQLFEKGLGMAGGEVEFAEPDLQQQWLIGRPGAVAVGLAAAPGQPDKQNPSYPTLPDNYWYRDAKHGQWDGALGASADPGEGKRVRIAHLDTGYDPTHLTLPKYLNKAQQKNFVDAGRENDASDDSGGLINNLGHGTGTLSILAGAGIAGLNGGKPFGCAPDADIVPVRVADSVILFRNSAIAKAFDYVHGLCADPAKYVNVITMSMGGVPSQAWADAVNALYEIGVFIVTAAGNNYWNLPTHEIVYPARFGRVVAACGVMADGAPYADLAPNLMAGDYGPPSKMTTAMAAFTPNVPWARFGARGIVDFDGNGTSAATPQVAAAAALWIQKHRADYDKYPKSFVRVEAIRKALFASARQDQNYAAYFGNGKVAALDALGKAAASVAELQKRKVAPDTVAFPLLGMLTGMGLAAEPAPRRAMLELEALQVVSATHFETPLPDLATGAPVDPRIAACIADELLAKGGLSQALRATLERGAPPGGRAGAVSQTRDKAKARTDALHLEHATAPVPPVPGARRLRVYAYDPSLSVDLDSFSINEATVSIGWEDNLKPGPVGEYLEIVDVDPGSGSCYAPVDLNHPHLLAANGLAPSEANPQFHQQMCYAVAMRTIEHFERALGRKAMWSSRYVRDGQGNVMSEEYVQRLRIYPHAVRAANSYYSPERKALLLGYFRADGEQAGLSLPGSRVFCAVSHDIIAHETTHALLDGLHRRYQEPTNPDVLAFHEAFADIVALFQHFSLPEALRDVIRKTRGDLGKEGEDNLLAKLAIQFGQAASASYAALRDALRDKPSRADYLRDSEPHARGSVLVSAVFAAFVSIYRVRAADLIRLATEGTGVLPPGDIPHDLVNRLADEASKAARHVLLMCIRALDYAPPIGITFGEYLRALITADYDIVPDDPRGYRVAFISAFRDRGIFPSGVKHLAVDSLLWEAPTLPQDDMEAVTQVLDLRWNLYSDRKASYVISKQNAWQFHQWLSDPRRSEFVQALGFRPAKREDEIHGVKGEVRPVEVHSVRPARRVGPDGQSRSDIVVELTQSFRPAEDPTQRMRGGCTLLIDLLSFKPRYLIRKRLDGSDGVASQNAFHMSMVENGGLRGNFYGAVAAGREPFALLHGRH